MDDAVLVYYQEQEVHTHTMDEDALAVEVALDEEEEEHDPPQVCWRNLCDDDARMKVISPKRSNFQSPGGQR